MAISAGNRFGAYEILSPLGAGGMGEVWKARDPRLGREAAIKVLPEEVASKPERLARFKQEARAASALNHPNIVTVYDIGQEGPIFYIAMELVQGKTLREMIGTPLRVKRLLAIGTQVAEGLAKAHGAGIVHRDIKPENVMVSSDGLVKILDFGLAKLAPNSPQELAEMPTAVGPKTQVGLVVGTIRYMSPEQANGATVDARSDQFSLGSVLYEMATGKPAFARSTVKDTLYAIVNEDPPAIQLTNPELAAPARWIIERCMAKDPDARYASTRDLARDLATVRDRISEVNALAEMRVSKLPVITRRSVLTAFALLGTGCAAGFLLSRMQSPPAAEPHRPARLAVPLADADRIPSDDTVIFDLSADGRQLVYVSDRGDGRRLILRPIDQRETRPIAGTDGAQSPFFSPDGRWIGFFADGKLKKVAVDRGVPVVLSDAVTPRGGVWLPDDTIVYAPEFASGLRRIAANGGRPEVLSTPDAAKGERTHRWPALLPGGGVLFTIGSLEHPDNFDDARVACLDPKTRRVRVLLENASMARFVAGGHLIFARAGSLATVAFEPGRREVIGEPVTLAERAGGDRASGVSYLSLAADGTLAYLAASVGVGERSLVLVDRKGLQSELSLQPNGYRFPRFSPDGKRLAVTIGGGRNFDDDIWICEIASGALTRLTFGNMGIHAVWSPDGNRVAFKTSRGNQQSIWAKNVDGSGTYESLEPAGHPDTPSDWAPDGHSLAITRDFPTKAVMQLVPDIWLLPLDGRGEARLFQTAAYGPVFSPDGRWLAYSSNVAGGVDQVLVQSTSGAGGKLQLTSEGGGHPVWAGRELFFVRRSRVYAMEVQTKPTLRVGPARALFEVPFDLSQGIARNYDVSPDGQRFVFVRGVPESSWREIDVVLNWARGLASR